MARQRMIFGIRELPLLMNYPKSVCTSINEEVCHGIPGNDIVLEEGDIVNVDVSTIYKGYYSDASRMFIIGKTSPEKEKLVRVAKECLDLGAAAAHPFGFVGDIAEAALLSTSFSCSSVAARPLPFAKPV